MKDKECVRNIFLYKMLVIFGEPLFWGPIVILSLVELSGMSLSEIYYMESVVLILCVVLEIPFGVLADTIGRKKTIVVGRFFLFLSTCFFAFMSNPTDAWIANILWAIGFTLQSGADTSLIYDTLKGVGRECEFKQMEGKSAGNRFFLIAFCSLLVGFLASFDLRLPLYLCIPFMFVPLVSSWFMYEPIQTSHYSAQKQIETLKQGVTFLLTSKEVRFMVLFSALLASVSKVWFFSYNPYFEIVKLDISYYGVIFFLLNMVAWISSHYAHTIESMVGERNIILGMVLCIGIPLIVMGLIPAQVCAYLILTQNIVRGVMRPFMGDYLHKHTVTEIRSTTLSLQSSVSNLVSILALAGFGFLMGYVSLLNSFVLLGIVTLVGGMSCYVFYRKKIE